MSATWSLTSEAASNDHLKLDHKVILNTRFSKPTARRTSRSRSTTHPHTRRHRSSYRLHPGGMSGIIRWWLPPSGRHASRVSGTMHPGAAICRRWTTTGVVSSSPQCIPPNSSAALMPASARTVTAVVFALSMSACTPTSTTMPATISPVVP